ncbi:protein mono-ADP-ribosyltransferase PARP14-like isoform X2 [Echeneis naucrates]|uniref:protein mono-ADP-ribosyltransferase PARP14-like isoform X2 n=1 Tax=Echeneis naucrates TaxID=173247 RepID=UPI001113A948|nr:protein mono-ADP-ribosyltransferase PARP14-like isoform X2 [Echeneis naucrates]
MEGPGPYPVYFQCPNLDQNQRKKIENYFHVRRKSGGGECGSVTQSTGRWYSIAFKEAEAQQRVLQRREHVLEFAGGPLVLDVQASPRPCSSTTGHSVSTKVDFTSPQKQQSVPASSPPPGGEEYELRPDIYLLSYLKECPEAGGELEEALTAVGCSAQIYPEEGRVVVKSLAPPAAVGEGRNWKAEVDKLFGAYLCHYEVDPHKVRALLQSRPSTQTTDEVKVYGEGGLAVVVGKSPQVNARLVDVEGSTAKCQDSRLSQKKTRVCRLGEAKLRLLWKDIEGGLGIHFPGVKVTQGDAGQVVLEGLVEDILGAGDWVAEKEKLVLERKVFEMKPHLLAVLRKAYGGPGILGDFLGFEGKVEMELRDTELCVYSFFANKLDEAEKKLETKFTELKLDVPNCSVVPYNLCEKLKSKVNEMNQVQYRAQVLFGSDSTLCLLGHTDEVEDLSEVVKQFILDDSRVEGKVLVHFPELVQNLPQLLQLHKFDYAGVTIFPLTASPQPMVLLQGPAGRMTEVRNRLGPFLDSLVQDIVTISLPAATRYFESSSGRDSILSVANSRKSLIQLREQHCAARQSFASGAGQSNGDAPVASYILSDGLQVLVRQGDITKLEADALVNAANEDLDHCGGVALALSKAGGPEIQRESKALVEHIGKIPTGDVVVTTGGNLLCKKLLHAVGPTAGRADGRERLLLEKAVDTALNLSDTMEFRSVALPCISSGVFGVPLAVCSEAIVSAVKRFGSQGGRSLSKIILIDAKEEAVRAMQGACDRHLQHTSTGNAPPSGSADRMRDAGAVLVEVVQGTIEAQQADALVSPMAGQDPFSTRIGHVLFSTAKSELNTKFCQIARAALQPGDIFLLENLSALQSKAAILLSLVPWDNDQNGPAVQALRSGLKKILACCQSRGFSAVALPVLGTGEVLHFPHSVASRVLLDEVRAFEQKRSSTSSFQVRIVIHPTDKESSKAFQSAQETLHLRGFTNDASPGQASFYRPVFVSTDEVTAMLGSVKLRIIKENIINEHTDVIVNTTDFSNYDSGVTKAILTAAGPAVKEQLAQTGIPTNFYCTTGPGQLGCREIIHANFSASPDVFRKNCKRILKHCESKGYRSVALPAINTGAARMDPVKACQALLDGLALAINKLKPKSLSLIHIVILQKSVFQAFRSELENRFGQVAPRPLTLIEKAKLKFKEWEEKNSKSARPIFGPERETILFSQPQPAVLSVICCGADVMKTIKSDLENILQKQLIERELELDFCRLDDMVLQAVLAKVRVAGISLQQVPETVNRGGGSARAEARDNSGSGKEVYVVRGLKEDVLSVTELVNTTVHKAFSQYLQEKEEAMVALRVQWLMQDADGSWQELSLRQNYLLEYSHLKQKPSVDLTAPGGAMVTVNLTKKEATNLQTRITRKVKRNETAALELPAHWDPMSNEISKRVELNPNSQEYQNVAQGFHKTAKYNIQKIERVQNFFQWHAYSLCKQRILTKNGEADLREMSLYHGTSAKSCDIIEKDRFDRSFAGTNAAVFGKGVYFAVNANYSATFFSTPDTSGLRRLYVARVLTGRYTVGKADMKAPPPRGPDPTDCFDSLVDSQQQPSKFVIFHDDQAYPEYLITFT